MRNLKAKDIADDVQQTFDNVSSSYRKTLENRIIKYGNDRIRTFKRMKFEQEKARRELWINTCIAVSGCSNTINSDTPINWADKALEAFDERFKEIITVDGGGMPPIIFD